MKPIMGDSLRGVNHRNSQAYQALGISHIVSKIFPIADFAYQWLMLDIQFDVIIIDVIIILRP